MNDIESPRRPNKLTTREEILKRLGEVGRPLAVHEFKLTGHSENNIATRLPAMAKAGEVVGRVREGKAFKEWALIETQRLELGAANPEKDEYADRKE